MGGYVRLSQTVTAVIVAPRWASYSHHVVISDSSKFDKSTNHISFPHGHITGSDIIIVIKHHSVYHTVQKKSPTERVKREPLTMLNDRLVQRRNVHHHPSGL